VSVPRFLAPLSLALIAAAPAAQNAFVNWETPHVSPLGMTPDGTRLLAVNTADDRLEVFALASGTPHWSGSIPVGLDPVSVRARTNTEAWVVNNVSDSVSVVDLALGQVVRTLDTDDEPCDVVFAGTPARAFVSCSQANTVLVFDLADLTAAPVRLAIKGEDPRAMAVSPGGNEVYVAIF
jgi:DNA-binding beta-propeller fold protein YncE